MWYMLPQGHVQKTTETPSNTETGGRNVSAMKESRFSGSGHKVSALKVNPRKWWENEEQFTYCYLDRPEEWLAGKEGTKTPRNLLLLLNSGIILPQWREATKEWKDPKTEPPTCFLKTWFGLRLKGILVATSKRGRSPNVIELAWKQKNWCFPVHHSDQPPDSSETLIPHPNQLIH